ncbi:MAG: hypothetical protein ACI9G1_000164 [Pirellulaceae bacterium]|jgi:hypothetical protein
MRAYLKNLIVGAAVGVGVAASVTPVWAQFTYQRPQNQQVPPTSWNSNYAVPQTHTNANVFAAPPMNAPVNHYRGNTAWSSYATTDPPAAAPPAAAPPAAAPPAAAPPAAAPPAAAPPTAAPGNAVPYYPNYQHGTPQPAALNHGGTVGNGYLNGGYANGGCATGNCDFGNGISNDVYGTGCGTCAPQGRRWYAVLGGLAMTRDGGNNVWLSLDDNDTTTAVLDTNDASMNYVGGYDLRLGRYFCDYRSGIEMVYWGIQNNSQSSTITAADISAGGSLGTFVDFGGAVFDNGFGEVPVSQYFVGFSEAHRVRRRYEFNNVEVNFFTLPFCSTGCLNLQIGAGVRYFRFAEDLQFAADISNDTFGDNNADEIYYDIDTENHLVGFQLTGYGDYCVTRCVSVFAGGKVGIFGNHVTNSQFIGNRNAGLAATVDNPGGAFDDAVWEFSNSKSDVSMVGEAEVGLRYRLGNCWALSVGYRAVWATGVALSTQQVPHNFLDYGHAQTIDTSGSLVLHGGFAQAEFNY